MGEVRISDLQKALEPHGLVIVKQQHLDDLKRDFVLYDYSSYDEYRSIQEHFNKQKLSNVWADESTLSMVCDRVRQQFSPVEGQPIVGLCHGTRNGFEQKFRGARLNALVMGTDISETATSFPNTVQWDFHDVREEWVSAHHFVYTNSLDQSWKPRNAVSVWLDQLMIGGLLLIEHTQGHSVAGASKMDPFGAKPEYMPYFFAECLGHRASLEIIKGRKSNFDLDVWLFCLKRLI